MPRFDAPSISSTSIELPAAISTQERQTSQGSASPSFRVSQFRALATRRAVVVLPLPRGPAKR
jgi:hypothetical protein